MAQRSKHPEPAVGSDNRSKYCNKQPFEVKKFCPDCKRSIPDPPKDGKKQCGKCLQYVIFEGGVAMRAVPKELM